MKYKHNNHLVETSAKYHPKNKKWEATFWIFDFSSSTDKPIDGGKVEQLFDTEEDAHIGAANVAKNIIDDKFL